MSQITRRDFLQLAGAATGSVAILAAGCSSQPTATTTTARFQPVTPQAGATYLSVAHGSDPASITRAAILAVGGIERFVRPGQDVIIKPNICTDYHPPEYAATTNPDVVAEIVRLCLGAGAKRVRVMDTPISSTSDAAYTVSGIAAAVKAAGGEMEVMSPLKYTSVPIPLGKDLTEWKIYRDILETNVLINVPIAKHHSLARLTLGMKNLLGVVDRPNQIHQNLGQRVAELASVIRPTLTVIDAYRILLDHGPTGGSLNDVKQTNTVIASQDMVSADAYGTTLFGLTAADIAYIKDASALGLGTMDLNAIKIEEINV